MDTLVDVTVAIIKTPGIEIGRQGGGKQYNERCTTDHIRRHYFGVGRES